MKNVKNAHVEMSLKPMKVVEIGPKWSGRWLGFAWVILELPDGTRTDKMHVGDLLTVKASFDFNEDAERTYSVK